MAIPPPQPTVTVTRKKKRPHRATGRHHRTTKRTTVRSRRAYCGSCLQLIPGVSRMSIVQKLLCEDCRQEAWKIVYDRDAGLGKIPPNLLKEYEDDLRKVSTATVGKRKFHLGNARAY